MGMDTDVTRETVSPELALVDPLLARRARTELAPSEPNHAARPEGRVDAAGGAEEPLIPRRWLALVALVVTGVPAAADATLDGGNDSVAGAPPIRASAATLDTSPGLRVAPRDRTGGRVAVPARRSAAPAATSPAAETLTKSAPTSAKAAFPRTATRASKSGARTPVPTRQDPLQATLPPGMTIVWDAVSGVDAYRIELRRGPALVYEASSTTAEVTLPKRWSREGRSYRLQPEDQAFVWAVVDGRRSQRALVDGILAFELTPVARFSG